MKRKPKIIKDKKLRGEWAESIFLARASEHGLPVSKPWGDSSSFDCVVGRPGKFVAVQVKSTVAELQSGTGYNCSVCSSGKPYPPGAFDYLAAYVVAEETWYLIPANEIRGMKSISLGTAGGKYERYLEAWHLLREACEVPDTSVLRAPQSNPKQRESEPAQRFPSSVYERMKAVESFVRRSMERGTARPEEEAEE